MADLSELDTKVKRYVRNCPSLMVRAALSDASRTFFGRSFRWTETVQLALVAGVYEYALPMDPAKLAWVGINWMAIEPGRPLDPASMLKDPIDHTVQDRPRFYSAGGDASIQLYPTPDKAYSMEVSMFVRNAREAIEIPYQFIELYGDAIAGGAVADLLNMEGYPWYNPKMRPNHLTAFETGIQQARVDREQGQTRAPTTVRMQPIA